ncbi:DUF1850 domain-containing protein [Virgibacillus byunsanensis]|uniref:DUF1850 domain-containing protein n=1 Tax=Virgibacillus byunsanensis TaxID=570945 RepID=UPI0036F30B79
MFLSNVHVMYAIDEEENILIMEQVNADTTFSSEYIHSVAKCLIIEKFEVNDNHEMVLMESWNCSFGAGIETKPPPGATDRLEDGFYVIDDINQVFTDISLHAVPMNEQIIKIDGKQWNVSEAPFVGKNFTISIEKENVLTYWIKKLSSSI